MPKSNKPLCIAAIVFLILSCIGSFYLGKYYKRSLEIVQRVVKVDTTIVVNPPSVVMGDINIYDTLIIANDFQIIEDSLIVAPITTKQYSSDNYKLQISGVHYNLDWIETYNTTVTNTVQTPLYRYQEINIGCGAGYTNRVSLPITVNYQVNWKYLSLEAGVGYDVLNSTPAVFVRAKLPIYRWTK